LADPLSDREELAAALDQVHAAAARYLAGIDEMRAREPNSDQVVAGLGGGLPEAGDGTLQALARLAEVAQEGATRSAGPRFFHFVTGGSTPAALGADWLASALDNNAGLWASSPLASRLEELTVAWMLDLLRLPPSWAGVLTTGATMANFTALAAARQWWGARQGADIAREGLGGLPPVPVLSSGFVHSSTLKALSMLGVGRDRVTVLASDRAGRLDLDGLEAALGRLGGAPALVVATAGEVNAGGFDPVAAMAELAHAHGSWLHVDGAFGLFARVSPLTAPLASGVEEADSAICDGHKWLNVPYDCGFAFVRDRELLTQVFGLGGAYLGTPDPERPDFTYLGPEMSRRARALPAWATLAAYGRSGYRALIERHVGLAQRLAAQVRNDSDFELLEEPVLNVVCFRHRPPGLSAEALDDHNRRLGAAVLNDGRVYFGTTIYRGLVAFRPAIANWRTTEPDIDLILPVLRELAASVLQ
jgi:glutamate/tyrosine decarboxylase-like PLP-dependent enzyme